MKKNDYWVSISDLMSGVVGVLVLFFVITILTIVGAQIAAQEEKQRGAREVVQKLSERSKDKDTYQGIEFFSNNGLIRLADSSFSQGSACINQSGKDFLRQQMSEIIIDELSRNGQLGVQIEGHTDIVPVGTSRKSNARTCAPFDDNYTLSAGRAREARNALFSDVDSNKADWMRRVSVVGYGSDRLIDPENPESHKNRRVEIRFVNIDN